MKSILGKTSAVKYVARNVLIVVGVSTLGFIALNMAAYYAMPEIINRPAPTVFDKVSWPHSAIGHKVLKEVFGVEDERQATAYNDASPGFSMHPSLSFITEPVRNEHFVIGAEGVRLEPGWDDDFVRKQLRDNRHVMFAFGGSTLLGHGIGSDHTIPFFINRALQGTERRIINLGSQAYDQHRSIEKLVYLLRAGYRPQAVVFLDGWNDMLTLARSNLRVQDKVVYHGFSTHRGEISLTPGDRRDDRRYLELFKESLPVYRLLNSYRREGLDVAQIAAERDAFTEGFDFYEAEFIFTHWGEFADTHRELLKKQIVQLYRENLKFLHELSRGFNFGVYSFYQPIGLLDNDNPFVNGGDREALGYDYVLEMDAVIRRAIASGQLNMVDLSRALNGVKEHKYVDVAHYSPAANKILAAEILRYLDGTHAVSEPSGK